MTPRSAALTLTLTVTMAATVLVAGCSGDSDDDLAERQEEVAERGAEVMPFDLEATTHRFEPTDSGVVQTVVADDPDDADQVRLVREHLGEEADRFRRGDFDDPAAIHGQDMPGLAELEAGAAAITIEYVEITEGARLTFSTAEPTLVDALHAWADAQLMDHGAHAENGHSGAGDDAGAAEAAEDSTNAD